jgi:hypothetical protein
MTKTLVRNGVIVNTAAPAPPSPMQRVVRFQRRRSLLPWLLYTIERQSGEACLMLGNGTKNGATLQHCMTWYVPTANKVEGLIRHSFTRLSNLDRPWVSVWHSPVQTRADFEKCHEQVSLLPPAALDS